MNCKKCDIPKKLFGKDLRCPTCWAATQKRNYNKRKKLMLIQHKEKRQRMRLLMLQYLLEHPCVDCGESNPIFLVFDHLHSKEFEINRGIHLKSDWADIEREIQKCEVRCLRCHKIKTAYHNCEYTWIFDNAAIARLLNKLPEAPQIAAAFIAKSGLNLDKYQKKN